MVHCGVTSSGTQSSGLTMQSQRRERERENQHQYNWNEFQYGCLQPPNKSVSAYYNNKAMSLPGKLLSLLSLALSLSLSPAIFPLLSFSLHHARSSLAGVLFSLTHTLARSLSIPLSLIVCLSLFLSLAPCNLALGAEDSPWQVSLVYTGTDGHRGNVRLILSKSVYGAKSWL